MKCCTLLRTLSPQIWFQMPLCHCWLVVGTCIELGLVRNFEPKFIVYLPEGVKGQMILSSTGVQLKGMLRTKAASFDDNNPCTKCKSHVLVNRFMRSETLPSSKPGTISDKTCGCSKDGNHASFHMLMASPQPILHLAPLRRTSLPFKMLFQACESVLDS